jgi:hypothetical protein
MRNIVVSVGLNVGTRESSTQYRDTLALLHCLGRVRCHAIVKGEWDGVSERTVHALIRADYDGRPLHPLREKFSAVALLLNQECIAVLREGSPKWELHYADGMKKDGGTVDGYPVAPEVTRYIETQGA